MIEGLSTAEIAVARGVAVGTVEWHVKQTLRAIGLEEAASRQHGYRANLMALCAYAITHDAELIPAESALGIALRHYRIRSKTSV
jgi:DNA-directed RNA polymerase specialized sigma24 family protein